MEHVRTAARAAWAMGCGVAILAGCSPRLHLDEVGSFATQPGALDAAFDSAAGRLMVLVEVDGVHAYATDGTPAGTLPFADLEGGGFDLFYGAQALAVGEAGDLIVTTYDSVGWRVYPDTRLAEVYFCLLPPAPSEWQVWQNGGIAVDGSGGTIFTNPRVDFCELDRPCRTTSNTLELYSTAGGAPVASTDLGPHGPAIAGLAYMEDRGTLLAAADGALLELTTDGDVLRRAGLRLGDSEVTGVAYDAATATAYVVQYDGHVTAYRVAP